MNQEYIELEQLDNGNYFIEFPNKFNGLELDKNDLIKFRNRINNILGDD